MTAVSARARLARQGNSTGLTLSREVLDAAGLDRGADVMVEAAEGRIVITPAISPHAKAMAAFHRSLTRYGRTYAILAKQVPADPEGALELPPADTLIAIHAELIARYGGAAGVRDPGALEAALARPANLLAYGSPGVGIERLAVTVCYSIVRIRHPFVDGNKRMGFAALVIILEMNGLVLDVGEVHAANIMNDVSAGRLSEDALAAWVSANTYPIEDAEPPDAEAVRPLTSPPAR